MGTKKGHTKYVSVELMAELFDKYENHTQENPRVKTDYVGREGKKVLTEYRVPLTMSGFDNFVYEKGIAVTLKHYFENKDERYSDYIHICRHIKSKIRQDQIEGGMVGQYSASITQRLNSLTEKQETTTTVVEQKLFGD